MWVGDKLYEGRAVIISTGAKARMLDLPSEQALLGHGVSTCATCDGFFFRGQNIAVVGGGDSALEEASFLTRFADKVTLVHRRKELRGSKIMQDRAFANPKIEFRWNSVVEHVIGDGRVEGLEVRDVEPGETDVLPVTGLFVAIGHDPEHRACSSPARSRRERLHHYQPAVDDTSRAGRLRRGRRPGPRLPPGDHRRRDRMCGRTRRGAVSRALAHAERDRPEKGTTVSNGIMTLSDATFDESIGGADTALLVDFWAEWCGPCKMIAPVLEEIASAHSATLQIAKLNVDDNPNIARRYDVMSIPTLLVFRDGEVQKRLVGAKGKAQLLEELAEFIG